MAYDIHIVRTEDWTESANAPITKMDVDGLIAADSDLAWSTNDYVEMADESGESNRYYMIMWRGKPCFWWYRDQILCSGPDDEQVLKLIEISRTLNAFAVGDDGEIYPLDQPSPTSTNAKQKPWWRFW